MTYYFIIIDGQQRGPFSKEELKQQGVTPQTPIWHEGMPDWKRASELPELADLFAGSQPQQIPPQPGYGYPHTGGPQQYQNPQYPGIPYQKHTNWLPWAIVGTVLGSGCCIALITGVIGIIYSCKANSAYQIGDIVTGDSANNTAKIMTIITLALVVLTIIACILMALVGIFAHDSYYDYGMYYDY